MNWLFSLTLLHEYPVTWFEFCKWCPGIGLIMPGFADGAVFIWFSGHPLQYSFLWDFWFFDWLGWTYYRPGQIFSNGWWIVDFDGKNCLSISPIPVLCRFSCSQCSSSALTLPLLGLIWSDVIISDILARSLIVNFVQASDNCIL